MFKPQIAGLISDFVHSRQRNAWLHQGNVSVYARKSTRLFKGKVFACLDIANITSHEEGDTRLVLWLLSCLPKVCAEHGISAFLFECVMVPELAEFLRSHGGVPLGGGWDQTFAFFVDGAS